MKNKNAYIVSYKLAELLKKIGFNDDVNHVIFPDNSIDRRESMTNWNADNEVYYSAPTLSQAIDWIYDTYQIFIEIDYIIIPYNYGKKFIYMVIDTDDDSFGGNVIFRSEEPFDTRYEAMENAIHKLANKLNPMKSMEDVKN